MPDVEQPLSDEAERSQIAERVRVELARARMKPSPAARQINMTPTSMSRRLNGTTSFKGEELIALADLLGIDVNAFYGRDVPVAQP